MMKPVVITATVVLLSAFSARSQSDAKTTLPSTTLLAEAGIGFGKDIVATPVSFQYHWNLGKKHRFIIGTGVRFTGVWGTDLNFGSAPSSLAGEAATEDTLFIANPRVFAANIILHLGYYITPKLDAGFSIDAIGFSAGSNRTGVFTSNGAIRATEAKPTGFNLLLVGSNDKGTLHSEFYLRYRVHEKLGIRAGYQYLFTEYTTSSAVQQVPEANDRFRNRSGLALVGLSYYF